MNYIIDWTDPYTAAEKLEYCYRNTEDFYGMRDSLTSGLMNARECAEAWIEAYQEREHWINDEEAEFTNDLEQSINHYTKLIEQDIDHLLLKNI